MKYRQSLIKYSEKYGVTRAAIKYDVTVNTFTSGKEDMMEHFNHLLIGHTDLNTTQISIQKMK